MKRVRLLSILNTLLIRGAGSGVAVLFTLLVSRHLETAAAARFFFLFNISTIAAICFRWGLDEVIIRRVAARQLAEMPGLAGFLLNLAHRRVLLWMAAGLAGALALSHPKLRALMSGLTPAEAGVVAISAAMVALVACAARVHQGMGRTNLAAFLLNIVMPLLSLIGLLLLVGQGVTIDAFDLILLYAAIALIAYVSVVLRRYGFSVVLPHTGRTPAEQMDARADRRAANKLGGVVLAQQVLGWGSLLIIPFAYGDAAYNGFMVAQKTASLVSLVMLAVNFTLSSRFASLHASGRQDELKKIARVSAAAILGSSLLVSLAVILLRQFTFEFARIETNMTAVLAILLAGQVFFALAALFSLILSMSHDEDFLLRAQGGINAMGVLVFLCASQLGGLEVACGAFVASYVTLALVLGLRARAIGAL